MNQQIYRIIQAHLNQTIEAAAIVPDKDIVDYIINVYVKSLDALPKALAKYGDFKKNIEGIINDPKELDETLKIIIPYLNNEVIPENGGGWSDIPEGVKGLSVAYSTNGSSGAEHSGATGITLNFNLNSGKELLEDWYLKKNKNKFIKGLHATIGHELIHSKQKGTYSKGYIKPTQKSELSEKDRDYYSTARTWLNEKSKELKLKDSVNNYFQEKGKIVAVRDFKRFFTKLKAKDPSWVKAIPPYIKPLYDNIKKEIPEEYQHIIVLGLTHRLYEKVFEKYERYSPETNFHTYLSDPMEIMAYAYSTVEAAHKEGYTKEELLEILNNPDKNDNKLYPIDHYKFYRNLKGDKNISDKEKKDTWHKYLKYVAEYIDKIYNKQKE